MKVISRGMPMTIAAQSPGRELLIHFVAQPGGDLIKVLQTMGCKDGVIQP